MPRHMQPQVQPQVGIYTYEYQSCVARRALRARLLLGGGESNGCKGGRVEVIPPLQVVLQRTCSVSEMQMMQGRQAEAGLNWGCKGVGVVVV